MEPLSHRYRERILKMMALSRGEAHISENNVLQAGNADVLPYIDGIIGENLLPGSEIRHLERLAALLESAKTGEPCLLLLEHYSNFDLPVFHYLLRKAGTRGAEIADAIIAIAGIKLNESNPAVLAFVEAYSRLVIYPSRSIEIIKRNLKDPKELVAEVMRSTMVNRAAMRALGDFKKQGKLILVFPAGTRFRPWDPSSKRGVREIDSYVKSFSKMCLVSVNGNVLRINPEGDMEEDLLCQDRVIYDVGEIVDCERFRAEVKHKHRMREDKKQAIVDEIMETLARMHEDIEKSRL
jgi:glycerol-3-phosphate O-acyltransferase